MSGCERGRRCGWMLIKFLCSMSPNVVMMWMKRYFGFVNYVNHKKKKEIGNLISNSEREFFNGNGEEGQNRTHFGLNVCAVTDFE